jgi:hypothetical protein
MDSLFFLAQLAENVLKNTVLSPWPDVKVCHRIEYPQLTSMDEANAIREFFRHVQNLSGTKYRAATFDGQPSLSFEICDSNRVHA